MKRAISTKMQSNDNILSDRTIFISSLMEDSTNLSIRTIFQKYGTVVNVKIRKKKNEMRKNTALVNFKTKNCMANVLKHKQCIERSTGFLIDVHLTGNQLSSRNAAVGKFRVYVGYVPKEMTDQMFQEIFQKIGSVRSCYIARQTKFSSENQYKPLFGFASFEDQNKADELLKIGTIKIPDKMMSLFKNCDWRKIETEIWEKKSTSEKLTMSLHEHLKDIPQKGYLMFKPFKVRTPKMAGQEYNQCSGENSVDDSKYLDDQIYQTTTGRHNQFSAQKKTDTAQYSMYHSHSIYQQKNSTMYEEQNYKHNDKNRKSYPAQNLSRIPISIPVRAANGHSAINDFQKQNHDSQLTLKDQIRTTEDNSPFSNDLSVPNDQQVKREKRVVKQDKMLKFLDVVKIMGNNQTSPYQELIMMNKLVYGLDIQRNHHSGNIRITPIKR